MALAGTWLNLAYIGFTLGAVLVGAIVTAMFIPKILGGALKNDNGKNGNGLEARLSLIEWRLTQLEIDQRKGE